MRIDNNIGFIHIPKTGGQSIEKIMLDYISKDRVDCLLYQNKLPTLGPPRLAHLTQKEYQEIYNYTPKKFFLLLRNPEDRFMSEVRFRNYNQAEAEIFLNKLQANMIYDDYRRGEDYLRHAMPQVCFHEQNTESTEVIKIKFEDFFDQPKRYLSYLGIDYKNNIPHIRPRAHSSNTKKNVQLTSLMRRKIEDFYKNDFYAYNEQTINIT